MNITKTTWFNYLSGFLLMIAMILSVTLFEDHEILLPEIAAMTAGMWIYQEENWIFHPRKITTVPTITASIGFFINKLPLNYLIKILLTAILILFILRIAQIYITPALATGFFPIIVNATHWSFLIAIVVSTIILMLGVIRRNPPQKNDFEPTFNYKYQYIFMIIFMLWILIAYSIDQPHLAAIPPIIVVFFEVLQKPTYPLNMALKHILVLTLSATFGFFLNLWISNWLIFVLISLPAVFLILHIFKIKLPAAFAFPLLALILPIDMFQHLPLNALISAIFFLGLAYLYKKFEQSYQKRRS